jgi:tetratricopeptide (TPR) repeat protein
MARVILGTGRMADCPYRIEKIERNVYSMEELCYSLEQSAQILDVGILDPELVDWIEKECGLPELAGLLRPYLGKERQLSAFVSVILHYVGFVTEDKEERTREIVSSGQGMESFQKRLSRAAYLQENAQPYEALEEYQQLLEELPPPERHIRAAACRAMGKIYAGQFRFRAAADSLREAFRLTGDQAVHLEYLACIRLGLSNSEYLAFIAEHPESYQASLELEKRMEEINTEFESCERKLALDSLRQYQSDSRNTSYEVALHQTIQRLKEEYRSTKAVVV